MSIFENVSWKAVTKIEIICTRVKNVLNEIISNEFSRH